VSQKVPTPRSLPRSLATSIGTSALDLGLFVCFSLFFSGPLLIAARWFSGATGAAANFAINRRWAFASAAYVNGKSGQLARYGIVAIGAVTLATLVFGLLRLLTPFDSRLAHLASLALVWLFFSYPLLRRWVFRCRRGGRICGRAPHVGRASRQSSAAIPCRTCR
jgi:putative flippase GtrA